MENKELSYEIDYDNYAENPRSWDNLGTMVCFHNRYDLGDKHYYSQEDYNSWEELESAIIGSENVHTILPLYLYDHSGITMNTSGFSCRWDSGQVGFIFITIDKVISEGFDNSKDLFKVQDYLIGEVETYDKYLTGEVYCYRIKDSNGEILDSCSGYYDKDECEAEAKSLLEYYQTK